jgi:hypothetical protein
MTDEAEKKQIKYNIGDVLEVQTAAGPKVHKRVTKLINTTTKYTHLGTLTVRGFEGSFVRRKDLYALKKRSVPYSGKEKLKDTMSFTFDREILRVVRRARSKGGR